MFKFVLIFVARSIKNNILKLKNEFNVFRKLNIFLRQGSIISNPVNITIGTQFTMSPYCQLFAQGEKGDSEIIIGNNVKLNYNVMINASCGGKISIGDNVMIGPYTVMRAANHKFRDISRPIYEQGHLPGVILIEEDVWLGAHVTVLPNVTIGKSSVIGAGSVVTKDIPPFSIAAGIPAKVIEKRTSDLGGEDD
jgi:galactoside O-acetyltransferase